MPGFGEWPGVLRGGVSGGSDFGVGGYYYRGLAAGAKFADDSTKRYKI